MKKLIFVFCLIALCLIAPAAMADDFVWVGLKYGSSAVSSAAFRSDYGLNFYNAVTGDLLYTSGPGETVNVGESGAGYASDGKFYAPEVVKLSIQSVNKTPITYNSSQYRGYFFLDRSGGHITVINPVSMDQYLYSVLGREMSSYFPAEALKAQAICAKNFVLGEEGRHQGFDVCTTTHCQVYTGVDAEAESTVAAVEAVSCKTARYNGKIVPLYFFATSGGKTESAENVWGFAVPYLQMVDDPFEPQDRASHYSWTTTMTGDEIGSRLAAKGYNIGTVTEITIEETTPSGRVQRMTLKGAGGSKTLTGDNCRTVIGADKLYGRMFTVRADGEARGIMTTAGPLWGGVVLTASGTAPMAGGSILSAAGVSEYAGNSASGSVFTFTGHGYGHGVGMSQWGAFGMAEQGYNYIDILKHYFTGITVE
ncbi:MAG: SpoIID/LytB domain-containing protein [Oscillospiraceae bacterium]|nr:SpoIID/LytB domain-containing protein [Oscillospiraceae bacterium]